MPTKPIIGKDGDIPLVQRVVAVLWPSFLTAAVATTAFFSVFNPVDLADLAGYPDFPASGGYTVGFFLFWLIAAVSGELTVYFGRPCNPPAKKDD